MLVDTLLRGLVVVRHHGEARVHADLLGIPGGFDCLRGAVGAGIGNYGGRGRYHGLDLREELKLLFPGERRRLSGGATEHETVRAGGEQGQRQLLREVIVHLEIFLEGRYHGGEHASELLHRRYLFQSFTEANILL